MTEHRTWQDELDEAWIAVCLCGWRAGVARRFDVYTDEPDPANAAHDAALADAQAHVRGMESIALRKAFQRADAEHTRSVQHGMALGDAHGYADTVQRKVIEATGAHSSLATLSTALVQALGEARERNADQQERLSQLATDAYETWKQFNAETDELSTTA